MTGPKKLSKIDVEDGFFFTILLKIAIDINLSIIIFRHKS